jgi:hypothetical protein
LGCIFYLLIKTEPLLSRAGNANPFSHLLIERKPSHPLIANLLVRICNANSSFCIRITQLHSFLI